MAVSKDGGADSQVPGMFGDQAGVSLPPNPAQPGAAKRHTFGNRERCLLDQERRLVEMETHAVE